MTTRGELILLDVNKTVLRNTKQAPLNELVGNILVLSR